MAKNRRDLRVDPPRYPVVTHEGLIKLVAVADNITGALELVEGEVVVSRAHAKMAWILLQKLYEAERRMDLWQAWESHQLALRAARAQGQTIPAFPDEYLPAEVQRRRAGVRPNTTTWTVPILKPIVVELAAPVDAPAPAPVAAPARKAKEV